jgi:hypothetical protein
VTRNDFVKEYLGPIDLEKGQRKTGATGWLLLSVTVILWDLWAIRTQRVETLTRSFWRLSKTSWGGFALQAIWGILTAHLLVEARLRQALEGRRTNKARS